MRQAAKRLRSGILALGVSAALLLPVSSFAASPVDPEFESTEDEADDIDDESALPPVVEVEEVGSAPPEPPKRPVHVSLVLAALTFPSMGFAAEAVRVQYEVFQWSLGMISLSVKGDHTALGAGGIGARSDLGTSNSEIGFLTYPLSAMRWGIFGPGGVFGMNADRQLGGGGFGFLLTKVYARHTAGVLALEAGVETALFWTADYGGAYAGEPPMRVYFGLGLAF